MNKSTFNDFLVEIACVGSDRGRGLKGAIRGGGKGAAIQMLESEKDQLLPGFWVGSAAFSS